jgi:ribose 5-phosphate isomerase A
MMRASRRIEEASVQPQNSQDLAKRAAGFMATEAYCEDGMTLGLGSGSSARWFVRALAVRVRDGLDVVGVPTSVETRDLARELGIRLADLDDITELDVTIDGANEIDRRGDMIKGGGAHLLREKIVARASRKVVVVADVSKLVDQLGAVPLPMEVLPFGWISSQRLISELLGDAGYRDVAINRRTKQGDVVVTDSGNYVLDVRLGAIEDAGSLATQLNTIPGVVDSGLFIGVPDELVVAHPNGTAEIMGVPLRKSVS